tara:strand:+ start:744 stop:1229 length:486 start_codon:yes stop_codon:yes gene_type:complete
MALLTSHIHGPSGNPSGAQGGIIQIRQNIYKTDTTFSTTNSFIDTGLTASITPTSSGNHVLVHCSLTFQPNSPGTIIFRILRGSTVLDVGVSGGGTQGLMAGTQDGSRGGYPSVMLLDTGIATTSETTYKVQVNISTTSRINGRDTDYRACSIMTLMEVSA